MTIKEIADKAGVSIGTVDRVIHNRGRVSAETTKKIKDIIKKFGYKPNIFASNLSSSKTYHFGVLMPLPDQNSGYWSIPTQGMKNAQQELKIYNVKIKFFYFDRYKTGSFKNACAKVIKEKPDGLLMAPVLTSQAAEFLKNQAIINTPCVLLDCELPEANYLSYIGQDSYQSGILSARLMSEITKNRGEFLLIRAIKDDYHIKRRAEGFLSFFDSRTRQKCIIFDIEQGDNYTSFETLLQKAMSQNPEPAGIFVTNASIHHAARYLKNTGKKNITLIGYDLIPENTAYLKEGVIDALISQQPYMQGYKGIYALFKALVLKEKVEARIMMPLDIIIKENIDYYQFQNFK